MYATFVKKEFSKKDWEHYGKVNGYMFMEKSNLGTGENIWAAFMMPTEDSQAPEGYYLLDDEELRRYDLYCKGNNIHPQPFDAVEIAEEKNDDGVADRMDVMKEWLQKKYSLFKA
jgi:hypothetical protein